MKKGLVLTAAILILAAVAFAQETSPEENGQVAVAQNDSSVQKNQTFTYIEKIPTSSDGIRPEDMRFLKMMAETSKVVKNAPYSASEVTETTQTLGDGNHIVNKTTASVVRDSEGRTRREEELVKIGSLQGSGPKIVTINDPVAHTEYVFQPGEPNSPGGVMLRSSDGVGIGVGMGPLKPKVRTFGMVKGDGPNTVQFGGTTNERGTKTWVTMEDKGLDADVKHESLGVQTIEGVSAEGTRDTRTIPAGAIGNEKPIVITSETWTSPDLQTVVLSKRNDPRFGETVYKLTGITRSEPDPSLFQPPSNLKKEIHGQMK